MIRIEGRGKGKETYQSPQSVMSITSCCSPKNSDIWHPDQDGYAADGGPHEDMSMESVAVVTEGGTEPRYHQVTEVSVSTHSGQP